MPTLAVGIDARKATIGAAEAKRAIKQVRGETAKLDLAQKRLATQMTATGASAKKASLGFKGLFAGMAGAAGFLRMTRTIAGFEESMARLQGVVGRTSDQMNGLEMTARKLGATTSFTASQAADGMLMLARAGMEAQDVIKSTGAVLDLAKVANVGLAQSSQLVADSLNQFDLRATQASKVADMFTHASNSASTSVEQLGEGLKLAGPLAASAGLDFAETSAILGVLANANIKATMGGTGLRAILASLAQPSDSAKEALEMMGIETDGLAQRIQAPGGLIEVFEQLGPSVMGLEEAVAVFSRRGATSALTLAKQTTKWKELAHEIDNANGVARESARLIEGTVGDQWKALISAIEEAILAIGESGFTAALKSAIQFMTEGVRALTTLDTGLTKAGASAVVFFAALAGPPVLFGLNKLRAALWALIKGPMAALKAHPVMAVAALLLAIGEAFVALTSKASFTTQAMKEFREAMKMSSESAKDLVGQLRMLQEFGGMKMLEGRVRILGQIQSEVEFMISQIKGRKDPGAPVARGDTHGVAMAAREAGVNVKGALFRGVEGQQQTIPGDRAVDELMRIHHVLSHQLQLANKNIEGLKKLEEKAQDAKVTPQAQDPGMIAQRAQNVDRRNIMAGFAEEMRLLNFELEHGARAAREERTATQLLTQLREHGVPVHYRHEEALRRAITAEEDKVQQIEDKLQQEAEKKDFADAMSRGVVQPLMTGLMSGDFRDVGRQMYMNLMQSILQEMVAKPLMKQMVKSLMTLMQADGGAWSGGVQRFARGGVVTDPTTFGMAGGRTGLMGEAGPEAIMPLKRLPSGKLGVQAQGSGTVVNDNRKITIQVKDESGMRRTLRQLDRDTARRIDEGVH